jgi:hypothetical protein
MSGPRTSAAKQTVPVAADDPPFATAQPATGGVRRVSMSSGGKVHTA